MRCCLRVSVGVGDSHYPASKPSGKLAWCATSSSNKARKVFVTFWTLGPRPWSGASMEKGRCHPGEALSAASACAGVRFQWYGMIRALACDFATCSCSIGTSGSCIRPVAAQRHVDLGSCSLTGNWLLTSSRNLYPPTSGDWPALRRGWPVGRLVFPWNLGALHGHQRAGVQDPLHTLQPL